MCKGAIWSGTTLRLICLHSSSSLRIHSSTIMLIALCEVKLVYICPCHSASCVIICIQETWSLSISFLFLQKIRNEKTIFLYLLSPLILKYPLKKNRGRVPKRKNKKFSKIIKKSKFL